MRIASGVPGFDEVVEGGFPKGSGFVIRGSSSPERDAFLVQFVAEGLSRREAAIVVLSSIPPEDFRDRLRRLGVDVEDAIGQDRLKFVDWDTRGKKSVRGVEEDGPVLRASIELADAGVAISRALAALPRDREVRAVIEMMSPALRLYDVSKVSGFVQTTKAKLERFGITSLFAVEKEAHEKLTLSSRQELFDGVVDLDRAVEADASAWRVAVLPPTATAADGTYIPLALGADHILRAGGATHTRSPLPMHVAIKQDRLTRFLAFADQRLKGDPRDADALFVRAAGLAAAKDLRWALETLKTLAEVDETYPGLWMFKEKLHKALGEPDAARQSHARGLEIEKRRHEASQEPSPNPHSASEPLLGCPSCGLAVLEEDEACPWCGVTIERPALHAPANPTSVEPHGDIPNPRRRRDLGQRGFTNGLAKDQPRGTGRTNGLARGTSGRTNGMTNGLASGMTNGLARGLQSLRTGMTNGLTNGSGFTNGLGSVRLSRETRPSRWKLFVLPLLAAALLLLPLFSPVGPDDSRPIVIDGNLGDWETRSLAPGTATQGLNPNVDIVRFGASENGNHVAFAAEVRGTALRGGGSPPTTDRLAVFLDTDRNPSTGYRVDEWGADRLLEVVGWGGNVNHTALHEWDANRDGADWRGWIGGTPVPAVAAGPRVEMEIEWLALAPDKGPIVAILHAQGYDGSEDAADFALNPVGASLLVRGESLVPDMIVGASTPLLRISAEAFGEDAVLTGLTVTLTGSAPTGAVTALRLTDGVGNLLDERASPGRGATFEFAPRAIQVNDSAEFLVVGDVTPLSGETVGVRVAGPASVVAGTAAVTVRHLPGVRDVGYLSTVATAPRVDGGYAEWPSVNPDPTGDVTGMDADIDLVGFGAQSGPDGSYFTARVGGMMFAGAWIPEGTARAAVATSSLSDQDRDSVPDAFDPLPSDFDNDGVPDAQSGGDVDGDGVLDYPHGGADRWLETRIPMSFPAPYADEAVRVYIGPVEKPYRAREDVVRVFVDGDNATSTGYAIGNLGAERMVELEGLDGRVHASGVYVFDGSYPGQWAWRRTSNVSHAVGIDRVEFGTAENLTTSGTRLFVETANALLARDSMNAATRGTLSPASETSGDLPSSPIVESGHDRTGTRTSTLVDSGSNAITSQYNHQRKVVRAGANAPGGPCDSTTNSDGCWYTVFYDQVVASGTWDRIVIRRSSNPSGTAWGAQVVLASGRASDGPLVLTRDSTEPSIGIDSGGFLHVVWAAASAAGDQTTMNLVRYTRTTVAWPTESQLASSSNWEAVTNVDDTAAGFMPTISTDSNNAPHVAWSSSKTSGTVYYKNKVGGTWKPTLSWGTSYTGISVDVSPQNGYVSLARGVGSWYHSGWQYRKALTISHSKVAATVTDFPVLINHTDADLQSKAQADGDDILFTSSDGTTKLSHEIEKYVGGTGELVAHVKVPTVSSATDTVLYMYYDNAAAANQQDAPNVWDANFKGVWHLKEGTGVPNADSTSNGNTGTPTNGPTTTTGKIDGALNLDGINDVIRVNDAASLDMSTAFTLSAWIRPDAMINANAGYNQGLLDKGVFGLFFDKSDGKLHFTASSSAGPSWTLNYDGAQEHIMSLAVYKGKLYAGGGNGPGDGDVFVYDGTSWTTSYNGAQEEIVGLAVYNGKLYAGQGTDAGDGDVLVFDGTSWTVSHDGAQERIMGLAVYNGKLYGAQGWSAAGDGDILVYDGTSWTISYDGAQEEFRALAVYNGRLYAGQGSSVTAGVGDVFVYDGTSWTVSYNGAQEYILAFAVYNDRLYAGQGYDAGDGDVLVFDGTSWTVSYDGAQEIIRSLAAYNGRLYAGQALGTGDGDALVFDGTSWTVSYDGAQEYVLSLAVYNGRLYAGQGSGTGDGDVLVYDNSKSLSSTTSSWAVGWHHVAASFDGTTMRLYAAGALDSSQAITFTPATNSFRVLMGTTYGSQMAGGSPEAFDGILDEIRISSVARSAGWITTEHNNQQNPATFYAVGGEELSTGAWWDSRYAYRRQVTITTGSAAVPSGYSVSLSVDHAGLVTGGKSQADGDDLRVLRRSGSVWTELDRDLDWGSAWNTASTLLWFKLQAAIGAGSSDGSYYLYYGNAAATNPPADWAGIFRMGDAFNDGTLTSGVATSINGACTITETGGDDFLDCGTAVADAGITVGTSSALPTNKQFVIRHRSKVVSGGGGSLPEGKLIGFVESAAQPTVTTSGTENARRRIMALHRTDGLAKLFYRDPANADHYWDGAAWVTSNVGWGTRPLDAYHTYDLVADGTNWYVRILDATGSVLTTTTSVPWSSVRDNAGESYWFYWGEVYTDFYFIDQRSDWVYVRDYVTPEPSTSQGAEESPNSIQYMVCKDVTNNSCDFPGEFTRADGTAGHDTVATSSLPGGYPTLATTWNTAADLWVGYTTASGAVYARLVDYPTNGWQPAELIDSMGGTTLDRLSLGVDQTGNLLALYVNAATPQLYYKFRTSGMWDSSRSAIATSSEWPVVVVRLPNDATYGTNFGGLYWKTSTSETYFFYWSTGIPEFEVAIPILGILLLVLWRSSRSRRPVGDRGLVKRIRSPATA